MNSIQPPFEDVQSTLVSNVVQELAGFSFDLSPDTTPKQVRLQARLCLLDTLGCMIAGSQMPEAKSVIAAEAASGGAAQAMIVGHDVRLGASSAARVNGYMGDMFELNDLIGGHASIGNVAAALAAAELNGSSGRDLVSALIAGIEVTARLYNAFYPHQKGLESCGMVSVGLPSSLGSAAAAARLAGLSRAQTTEALAIAGAIAGWCPAEVIFGDGGTIKPMLFGSVPAASGLQAVSYAAAGLTGPGKILEGSRGYFATMATAWDMAAITTDEWALMGPRRKLHACCGYIHSSFDALSSAVQADGLDPDQIERIDVRVPKYIIPAISKAGPPTTPNEARFHIQYILAHAACGATVVQPDHSNDFPRHIQNPQIARLTNAIAVSDSDALSHYHQSRLTIHLRDGRTIETGNDGPRGTAQNPMTDAQVIDKFRALSDPIMGEDASARIVTLIDQLDDLDDLAPLLNSLGAP